MTSNLKPLRGLRVLSLALNLPGPAALMRLRVMGAQCTKLEPLAADGIGRGIVSGVTICRVWADAEAQEYQFAEAEQGVTNYLRMVESGSAQVLWREAGTGLKWAIVRLGNHDEDQRLIHFELTDELQLGGYAPAKQLEWTGGTWLPGKDITVIDWYTSPSMWQGYAGYRGLALDRPGTENQFDIVWMETPARSIEFQLTQNMEIGRSHV